MLNLYINITPNLSNNVHYYFDNFSNFRASLTKNLLTGIKNTNYTFNSGKFRIALTNALTKENYKNVTYIIDTETKVCYFVNDSIFQSGYVEFNCRVDNWGTYIASAKLSNIEVVRTNKDIGVGEYDEIKTTIGKKQVRFKIENDDQIEGHTTFLKNDRVVILAVVTYNVQDDGTGAVTATNVYAATLPQPPVIPELMKSFLDPLTMRAYQVSGIYQITKSTGLNLEGKILKAKTIKIYALPQKLMRWFLDEGTTLLSTDFKCKSLVDFSDESSVLMYKVELGRSSYTIGLDINPNYNYYVGTIDEGIKVKRRNKQIEIKYTSIVDNDGVKVIVSDGENQKDITSAFEVPITQNNGDLTGLTKIEKAIKSTLGIAGNVGRIASGDYLGGGLGLANNITDTALTFSGNSETGQQIGNGDGLITFLSPTIDYKQHLYYSNPFGYSIYESLDDEVKNAARYGITYNDYISNLDEIFNAEYLNIYCKNTYLKAVLNVDGIPIEASNEIKQKFNNGILIQKV